MEAAKKMMEKLTGGKKLQKDQCLIIILVGILLCVIAVPAEKKDSKSGLSNIIDDTIDDHKVQTGQEDTSGYAGYWEEKLEEALRCVEGVGKVREWPLQEPLRRIRSSFCATSLRERWITTRARRF